MSEEEGIDTFWNCHCMNNVGYTGQDTPFPLVFTVRGVYYDIFTGHRMFPHTPLFEI